MRAARTVEWFDVLDRVARLGAREREVFALLAASPTYEEIAQQLFVTERTVRAHVAGIQEELELRSKSHLCAAAVLFALRSRTVVSDNSSGRIVLAFFERPRAARSSRTPPGSAGSSRTGRSSPSAS